MRFKRLAGVDLALAALVLGALLGGCWSSGSGNGSNVGPPPDGGLPDLGASVCNALQAGSPFVQSTDSGISPIPAATGGTLADGSYHLTSTTYYPAASCSPNGVATALVIASSSATTGSMQTATVTDASIFISESVSYLIQGASLSVRIDCVAPDALGLRGNSAQISFNATPTEIQLYESDASCGDRIDVYDLD